MPDPYTIRWMIRRDMPEVLSIESESFEFPWTEREVVKCLRQPGCLAMVAEYDGRVVGFMVFQAAKASVRVLNFAVAESFRRRGVGSKLIAVLLDKFTPRARITLEVRETNLPAQLFFRRLGFLAVSVLRQFYADTPEDAYVMVYRWHSAERRTVQCSATA